MTQKTKERVGTFFAFFGLAGFFFFMQILGIFGSTIEYTNPIYVLRMSVPWIFMISFTYLALRLIWDPIVARNFALQLALGLIIAYFIGLVLHG